MRPEVVERGFVEGAPVHELYPRRFLKDQRGKLVELKDPDAEGEEDEIQNNKLLWKACISFSVFFFGLILLGYYKMLFG